LINNYSEHSDSELIHLMREPKPASDIAFNEIYQRHSRNLYAYCMYKLQDKELAEDILQDIWVNFHDRCQSKEHILKIRSYLVGIAHNMISDYLKKNKTENSLSVPIDGIDSNIFLEEINFQKTQDDNERISFVRNAVNILEDIYREVYVLKIFEDLTYTEIAKLTGEPIKTIQSRFRKASLMLNEIILPYMQEFNK
jgi:RNA polymerase sigma-70 factor, ECF subfamily